MGELGKVMIYRQTLPDSCRHCAKSKTYCDGRLDLHNLFCCDGCRDAEVDPH